MTAQIVPFLADHLSPQIRVTIARALSESMRGRLSEMANLLQDDSSDCSVNDAVGRAVSLALLLHLNRQPIEALKIIDGVLASKMEQLPHEIRLILEQNRIEICFGQGLGTPDDTERHYGQIDRRHVLGVTFGHADALLEAATASLDGKNYNSLPIYTSCLFDAYRRFDWLRIRQGAEYLCRELLRVGQPVQAAFCAIVSESEDVARLLAKHLRAINDPLVLDAVLKKITETAHLSRHVTLVCYFLHELNDAVPDDFVPVWLERLSAARRLAGSTLAESWASEPAWKATAVLLQGAKAPEALQIVEEVLKHPRWSMNDIARMRFYEALDAAVATVNKSACRRIVGVVAPHVLAQPPGHDFRDALRLLLAVADRSPSLRTEIRRKLYRRGRQLPHLLVSIADVFEQHLRLTDTEDAVNNAILHLGFQVERLPADAKPSTGFGESMIYNKPTTAGYVAVKVGSCREELNTLVQYRKTLSRPLKRRLVEAILQAVSDPDNDHANRIGLFDILRRLSDSVDSKTARRVADVARRYASDHRVLGHPFYGEPQQHSPLNPFRFTLAWPQQVRGAALMTLAQLANDHRHLGGLNLAQLIFAAIADSDPELRNSGYQAVHLAGTKGKSCLPAVVGGIRDSDPTASNVALQVVGVEAASVVKAGLVTTVLSSIESHSRHPDTRVRRAGATVVQRIRAVLTRGNNETTSRLDALTSQFQSDVSRSVREAMVPSPNRSEGDGARRQRKAKRKALRGVRAKSRHRERPLTIKPAP